MSHSILITGGSGYLGGTLLALLADASLPAYKKLYATVRTDEQAAAVQQYRAEPLRIDINTEDAVVSAILEHRITIVYHLTSAISSLSQSHFIKGLSKDQTSGAKIFSGHAGAPTDRPLYDDEDIYSIQQQQDPPVQAIKPANLAIIDLAEKYGVRAYIFAPCIVYGEGRGFGNKISIQTQAIVKAAKSCRAVYSVDQGKPTWPVCHVDDNTTLYLKLLKGMLSETPPPCGRQGFYLASPGSVAWFDIYSSIAKALAARGIVDSNHVKQADDTALQAMADGLGCPKQLVGLQLGGLCTYTARRGENLGWKAVHPPEHILDAADKEVELILKHMK